MSHVRISSEAPSPDPSPRPLAQRRHRGPGGYGRWRGSHSALFAAARGLIGIAVIVALAQVHGSWLVSVVAVGAALTIPGFIALRALRVPAAAVEAFPLYVPAASLLVLMLGGLGADLIGPLLGDTRPLSGEGVVLGTVALSVLLLIVGFGAHEAARLPWRRMSSQPSALIPLVVPAVTAAGALLLNNGHGDLVARIGTALTVAVFLFGLVFSSRLTRAQLAIIVFACALAAEWAFSLRSRYIVGFDISTEIQLARGIHASGIWHASNPGNAYGAMLSLTILPSTLSALTGISPLLSFKLLYPALAALLPLAVYLVATRFMPRTFAIGAAALLVVQSYFFLGMPQLARQEVGLLFFAVLVAGLLDCLLSPRTRSAVVALAGVGLVVSHYSSAYVAVGTLVGAGLIQLVLLAFPRTRVRSAALLISGVLLGGSAFLWYGPITHSSGNLSQFAASLKTNGLQLNPTQTAGEGVLSTYLNGNVVAGVGPAAFERLAVKDYRQRLAYIHPFKAARDPVYALQPAKVPTAPLRSRAAADALNVIVTATDELLLLLAFLGTIAMLLRKTSSRLERQLGMLATASIGALVVIRFSGTVAQSYNQQRALLQGLIVLAIPAAWIVHRLTDRSLPLRRVSGVLGTVLLAVTFAANTGLGALLAGGGTSLNLSQSGEDFERLYVTRPELAAATWANIYAGNGLLYADRYGQLRLFQTSGHVALTDVTPETLDRDAWIYGSRTNIVLGRARGQVGSYSAIYRWPQSFISRHYDTVFTDGSSEVFH